VIARPYWYKECRERKHRSIHDHAIDNMVLDSPGPFPSIYADPPWQAAIIALFRGSTATSATCRPRLPFVLQSFVTRSRARTPSPQQKSQPPY
jgi:hypothetical protein